MKQKFTLIMLAVLFMAATVFAQGQASQRVLSQKHLQALTLKTGKNAKQHPSKKSLQMQNSMEKQQGLRASVAAHNKMTGKKAGKTPRALRRSAADIISEQPEGKKMVYSRSGFAYFNSMFGVFNTELNGAVGSVVFGADNKVYIKDIVSQAGIGAWVVGTISGSTITVNLPQTVYALDGYNLEVSKLKYQDDWYVKTADQTLKLNYNAETGEITTPEGPLQTGDQIIGLTYDDDDSWAGYADWNITMTPVTDELVEAPADLKTEQYTLVAESFEGEIVQVGFSGDDVYVQGIDRNLPDTWVKGTISGNKVLFKSGQYVGADEVAGNHQYLMSVNVTEEYDEYDDEYYEVFTLSDADIEFEYDATTKTLSKGTPFMLNAGKTIVSFLAYFVDARMAPFTEVAATPAVPQNVELVEGLWDYYQAGYGWGAVYFSLITNDVDGNYILPEKLSYQIYTKVNGEVKPLTLSWNDYINQTVPTMTEIPYGYGDDWDISPTYLYYYVIGPEAYGIQTIYRGAGEERRSEIVWVDVAQLGAEVQPERATPVPVWATVGETDNRIDYGFYNGEGNLQTVTNNKKPETYDVAIKLDDPSMVGTAIESITFPLQEVEGVTDVSVFLTSQLRVEDNKNAADLIVKAVTPAEPGFITVTLDKPYQIPEGGVYVGYSMTIADASSEPNANPIAISDKVNEGGFYLHTSEGFLKWLDVAEGFGGSSIIQVKLAGSAIKGNAAAVAEAKQQFVMAGENFTVPVTVINHGANGIKSFDITYSVGEQKGTQHFDANVDAFFGKSTTVSLNVPAIATRGNYELALDVDKVNDAANEDAVSASTISLAVLTTIPKKRTLLEEYTGLWCGYCPRGYVALEKLAELYPDDYVLVSYHNADDMEIMDADFFPSYVSGFPEAWMDRDVEMDPYYGTGTEEFGVADELAERNKLFGCADLNITTSMGHDQNTVNVTTEVTFPYDVTDANYAVEYIVTADGLTDASWGQTNYFAGGSMGYPKYMDVFANGESTVFGLVFNDVAVLTSEQMGGSENAVTSATADTPVKLKYSFNLSDAVNTSGNPIIQNVDNVKVVALLIDRETGIVVNANKCKLGASTGIVNVKGSQDANAAIFDMMGRRVSQPAKGLYITNGRKVVIK